MCCDAILGTGDIEIILVILLSRVNHILSEVVFLFIAWKE